MAAAAAADCSDVVVGSGLLAAGAAAAAGRTGRPRGRLRVWDGQRLWPVDPGALRRAAAGDEEGSAGGRRCGAEGLGYEPDMEVSLARPRLGGMGLESESTGN